ncbi:hypothetical protein Shpa_43 [Paracoccus phage Shpa]|uniref:Uncharacterized protein n=1 Tax=Paracoccus phage Shpa TaxID=1647282 RepID=A0A0U2BX55_9CAUD|nr:hypothetical protein FDG85_gp43 [Paracoccus phage Shpa]AKG94554.1 hypothetical protein Shpa_43 [Paracoccus phage Shpa]
MGHNETAVRLAGLAGDAQIALDKVARGEADAIEGWLAYGAALNEGRALFAEDKAFGRWIAESLSDNLSVSPNDHERAAAMWAAANADQLAEAKANSKARTLRGWHEQWKKIKAEREAEARKAEQEAARKEAAALAQTAKAEAQAREHAEATARAEAAAATDEAARAKAEARAEAERKAKEAAEAQAAVAERVSTEAAPEAPEEEIPADVAAAMRKHSGLTREALLRDYAELIVANKAERAKDKAEIARLKERLNDLEADDKNEVIRRLQRQVSHAESEKWRANEETRRAMRQVYVLNKRVQELESMGITL